MSRRNDGFFPSILCPMNWKIQAITNIIKHIWKRLSGPSIESMLDTINMHKSVKMPMPTMSGLDKL